MPKHQYSLELIQHSVNDSIIEQRASDGYINATALCHVAGKRWHNYLRDEPSGKFLRALSAKTQISISELTQEMADESGISSTWIHPKVAINLGQWLSADFAVQVSEWVYEWMSGNAKPSSPAPLPVHLKRYLANDSRVPQGYFSILQETALSLFGPMHLLGFEIPSGWVPDISVGRCYCAWLRSKHNVNTNELPTYAHDYLDGRPIVQPNVYPEEYLADFRNWFRNEWLPNNGSAYFKKKDPASMLYFDKLPAIAAPSQQSRNLPRA